MKYMYGPVRCIWVVYPYHVCHYHEKSMRRQSNIPSVYWPLLCKECHIITHSTRKDMALDIRNICSVCHSFVSQCLILGVYHKTTTFYCHLSCRAFKMDMNPAKNADMHIYIYIYIYIFTSRVRNPRWVYLTPLIWNTCNWRCWSHFMEQDGLIRVHCTKSQVNATRWQAATSRYTLLADRMPINVSKGVTSTIIWWVASNWKAPQNLILIEKHPFMCGFNWSTERRLIITMIWMIWLKV